ncbi:MAG: cytidine deaminase [Bacteroidaceae bacterium]|nr:cytidine deaminase [Bacteroidaceae bacterium]
MKNIDIVANILVCNYNELTEAQKNLIDCAKEACMSAYAPYSQFNVGAAALLDNGEVVSGSNQENAAYPSGTCAERTTLFYAGAQYPNNAVTKLAIAAYKGGEYTTTPTAPCGACRQVILETEHRYNTPIEILLYGKEKIYIIQSIESLLPLCFGKTDLE